LRKNPQWGQEIFAAKLLVAADGNTELLSGVCALAGRQMGTPIAFRLYSQSREAISERRDTGDARRRAP
jgi:hypothetical protein